MKFQITTPDSVKIERISAPYLRINKSGLITFTSGLSKAMNLSVGDNVIFVWEEEEQHYYIGKAPSGQKGFVLVNDKSKKNKNYLKFNSSGLVNLLKERLDLPLAKDKLASVKYDVDLDNPIEHFGTSLYKIF